MHRIYTARQAQLIDEHTIKNIGIPSLVLMERAALGVTERVIEVLDGDKDRQVICVCGKGNNGADGLCIARQLRELSANVAVYICGSDRQKKDTGSKKSLLKGSSDFEIQLDICKKTGVRFLSTLRIPSGAVLIEGIFGNGLDREIGQPFAGIITKINRSDAYVISVDIPAGINAGTGQVMGTAVRADETVTFGSERLGHVLYPGNEFTGRLKAVNIGWQTNGVSSDEMDHYLTDKKELDLIPYRPSNSNKGCFGNGLIVAGSEEYGGAPVLSAAGAFMSGAGLVRVFTHKDNRSAVLAKIPEAIVVTYENIQGEDIEKLKYLIKKADAIVAGPGMGQDETSENMVRIILENAGSTLILDADGLNLISCGRVKPVKRPGADIIVTPHIKEASALLGCGIDDVAGNMTDSCLSLHKLFGAYVILKSSVTVMTDGRDIFINKGQNSGMAVAGSGDVLAGIIGGLAGQGLKGKELMTASVYLHGAAGNKARDRYGEYGMLPSNIAICVRDVLKSHEDSKKPNGEKNV